LFSWDDLNELLNQYPDVAATIYGVLGKTVRTETESIRQSTGIDQQITVGKIAGNNIRVKIMQSTQLPPRTDRSISSVKKRGAKEPADLHSEIDEAASHLEKGEPQVALSLLQRIEKRYGARLTKRCHYRIEANMGHAYRAMGNFKEAGRLYLSAKAYQPKDKDARFLEAFGRSLLDDEVGAHNLAENLIRDFPEFPKAKTIWLATAPGAATFAEMEKKVPPHQRGDSEVALGLARAAAEREELEPAEKYARAAFETSPEWPHTKIELGCILLMRAHPKVSETVEPLRPETKDRLTEAVKMLTQGINAIEKTGCPAEILPPMLNLAAAYHSLGQTDEARREFVLAFHKAPDDVDVLANYAQLFRNRAIR
jgi:tetratricopeptide (TPR) repeat protein